MDEPHSSPPSTQSSTLNFGSAISTLESELYYAGLPSFPCLVGRTSPPWEKPTGPEAYCRPKVLGTIGRHAIKAVWEDVLSHMIIEHLDLARVAWTSIDVVRIGYADDSIHPVILWIGVKPGSLSFKEGNRVAATCQNILVEFSITDVDVEIRESLVTPLVGPKLLKPTVSFDPVLDVRNSLTHTLGLPIASKPMPWVEGTASFFIAEGGESKRLFLVTARHVVIELSREENNTYEYKPTATFREVILFGDTAFRRFIKLMETGIERKTTFLIPHLEGRATYLERQIEKAEGADGSMFELDRKDNELKLTRTKKAVETLNHFYKDVMTQWASKDKRVLGHVLYSPPIKFSFGRNRDTQDLAIVDFDLSKIDVANFEGNFIDLGSEMNIGEFMLMICPNLQIAHKFMFPLNHLLRLRGTIPVEEMRDPPELDKNGDPCLMVVKNGNTTALTIGRANDVRSCVRNYFQDDITDYSMEWPILSFDIESGPFAAPGDSGAVVADYTGRLGGIITSGAGCPMTNDTGKDIIYVTSIDSIMTSIKVKFPKAHLNPVLE